jgi:hypothetical protein
MKILSLTALGRIGVAYFREREQRAKPPTRSPSSSARDLDRHRGLMKTRLILAATFVALLTACQTRQMAHCPCANQLTLSGPRPPGANEILEACHVVAWVGYVVGGASFPLSGQTVEFLDASNKNVIGTSTTDSNGQARFTVARGKIVARAKIVVGNTLTSSEYFCEATPPDIQ